MKHLLKLTAGILLLAGNFVVQAQFHAPGGLPPGFHHALLDVLASGPAFYGRGQIQLTNGPDKEPTVMSCNVAVLSGCMRLEVDTFLTGSNMPPDQAANLKNMHSISILRPDKNRMYLVFPDYKSYVELAYAKTTGTDPVAPPKIKKTLVGKETIGEQPCSKGQWNITEDNGEQYDITVWMATNLNNFPIKIKVGPPAVLVQFQDWHMEPPDSALFVPPADYTKYEGIQSIIQQEAEKPKNVPVSQ
jgi:hypothetical protein